MMWLNSNLILLLLVLLFCLISCSSHDLDLNLGVILSRSRSSYRIFLWINTSCSNFNCGHMSFSVRSVLIQYVFVRRSYGVLHLLNGSLSYMLALYLFNMLSLSLYGNDVGYATPRHTPPKERDRPFCLVKERYGFFFFFCQRDMGFLSN